MCPDAALRWNFSMFWRIVAAKIGLSLQSPELGQGSGITVTAGANCQWLIVYHAA
jgi:hypothetical protein